MSSTTVGVGTVKGLFLFKSDDAQKNWKMTGPILPGWEVSALNMRSGGGLMVGTVHYAYGATIRTSTDHGATWTQPKNQPKHPENSTLKMKRIWQIANGHASEPDTVYAGVDEAALFVSRDKGQSWAGFKALNEHPTRDKWFPGAGGLCLHTIVVDHANPKRIWAGVSAAGMFGTSDGGESWSSMNTGIAAVDTGSDDAGIAHCIHKVVQHPADANKLYMQYHGGLYRTGDGAKKWSKCENGVPSNFGFPMVVTKQGNLFCVPLEDSGRFFKDGKMAIYRSTNQGDSWEAQCNGLPQTGAFSGVLRDAMAVDSQTQKGVFFGTTSGEVFGSTDNGESWFQLPGSLPRVLVVRAV